MNFLVLIFVDDTPVSGNQPVSSRMKFLTRVNVVSVPAARTSCRTSVSSGTVSTEIHRRWQQEAVREFNLAGLVLSFRERLVPSAPPHAGAEVGAEGDPSPAGPPLSLHDLPEAGRGRARAAVLPDRG